MTSVASSAWGATSTGTATTLVPESSSQPLLFVITRELLASRLSYFKILSSKRSCPLERGGRNFKELIVVCIDSEFLGNRVLKESPDFAGYRSGIWNEVEFGCQYQFEFRCNFTQNLHRSSRQASVFFQATSAVLHTRAPFVMSRRTADSDLAAIMITRMPPARRFALARSGWGHGALHLQAERVGNPGSDLFPGRAAPPPADLQRL